MSQYPNPYPGQSPPIGYYPAPRQVDPLSRAKRAGLLMIIIGSLSLLCGGVYALVAQNWDAFMAQQSPEMRSMLQQEANANAVLHVAETILIIAFVWLALGIAVRRGGKGPTLAAIILTLVMMLLLVFFLLGGIFALSRGNAAGIMGVVMSLLILAVFGWQLAWLIQAITASSQVKQMQAAYQAQYWQYMQQQQAYNAAGYNQNAYNAPPTGPAQPGPSQTGWQWPAPPPPPGDAPQNPPSQGGPHGQGPQ